MLALDAKEEFDKVSWTLQPTQTGFWTLREKHCALHPGKYSTKPTQRVLL